MNNSGLVKMLHDKIPLVHHMGISVAKAELSSIQLLAVLELNKNHRGTAFGGSLSGVLTLAAWSWLTFFLDHHGLEDETEVVIQACTNNFLKPVIKDFIAEAFEPTQEECQRFLDALNKKGKARLNIKANVVEDGLTKATFNGQFVAIKS